MYRNIKNVMSLISLAAVILILANPVLAQKKMLPPRGLFSDVKANNVGDIVTIIIQERANSLNRSSTTTNKSNTVDMSAGGGNGLLKYLKPLGYSQESSNQYNGSGEVATNESFNSTLSARIVQVLEDGNFLIKASREVETSGEKQITIVQGIVRPYDITANNNIYSYQIANVSIYHQGKGVVNDAHRPGLFTRIINWIF